MNLIDLLIYVFILGLVFYVVWWGLARAALPEPFGKVATIILVIIAVILLLRPLMGGGIPHFGI